MFKHSCFIENSKEAREWLESIGYNQCYYKNDDKYIMTNHNIYTSSSEEYDEIYFVEFFGSRDCRSNLPLFKALTAVRDDNDYMQWFVCDLCFFDEPLEDRMILCEKDNHNYLRVYSSFHKATKEELIEKFKK